jgi:hypothetical protein
MVEYALDHLVLISREAGVDLSLPPGQTGDVVEVHCVGGPVKEVDPRTYQTRDAIQRFRCGDAGAIVPVHNNPERKPRQKFTPPSWVGKRR